MVRHTLKEFMEHYKADNIQLVFGYHIVNIQSALEGSLALVRHFEKTKFDFGVYNEKDSYLRLNY